MFVIRQAILDDLPTLLKLAKMVHFINLPADKDLLAAKVSRSRRSFGGDVDDIREREFMFVLEDGESGEVVGTCSILCCVSWEGRPHIYLKTGKRSFYSEDLQLGQTHVTLELGTDTSGPSEVGGLILAPGFRGRPERLGSLLSLIRFHFIGLHREQFAERILAEMMGPLTPPTRARCSGSTSGGASSTSPTRRRISSARARRSSSCRCGRRARSSPLCCRPRRAR